MPRSNPVGALREKGGLLSGSPNLQTEASKSCNVQSRVCGQVDLPETLRISMMHFAHNGLVAGSSPAGPTKHFNRLDENDGLTLGSLNLRGVGPDHRVGLTGAQKLAACRPSPLSDLGWDMWAASRLIACRPPPDPSWDMWVASRLTPSLAGRAAR